MQLGPVWVGLRYVIVVFPDHTHLLFGRSYGLNSCLCPLLITFLKNLDQDPDLGPNCLQYRLPKCVSREFVWFDSLSPWVNSFSVMSGRVFLA